MIAAGYGGGLVTSPESGGGWVGMPRWCAATWARNRGADGYYWSEVAHRAAHERRKQPKEFRLVANPGLCRYIEDQMDSGLVTQADR